MPEEQRVDLAPGVRLLDTIRLLSEADREVVRRAVAGGFSGAEVIVHIADSSGRRSHRAHAVALRARLSERPGESILLAVCVADRHAEIATAPAFADRFTPEASSVMLRRTLIPLMRDGEPARAVAAALAGIATLLAAPPAPPAPARGRVKPVLVAVVGLILAAGACTAPYIARHLCDTCHGWSHVTLIREVAPSGNMAGEKVYQIECPRCGAKYTETRVISADSSSDSGTSDTSGGGSSDGGGGADW
jgi:uncharacterized membrane protein YgcG